MRKLVLTLGAVAAWALMGHIGLLAILLYVWASAMASTTNTAKTRAVEQRVNALAARSTVTPQGTPGTCPNTSVSIAGQNTVGTAPGGANAAWYQEVQATIDVLFQGFNELQSSYANTVSFINTLVGTVVNSGVLRT